MTTAEVVRMLFEGAAGGCIAVLLYRVIALQKQMARLIDSVAEARADLETLADPELGLPAAKMVIRRRKGPADRKAN